MYTIEITCDAAKLENVTAKSPIDVVAVISAYLCRGSIQEKAATQKYLARELPRALATRGFACFAVGAVVATVERGA